MGICLEEHPGECPPFFRPVKKTTLYADPKYVARVQDELEFGTTEKIKGQRGLEDTEPQAKAASKPTKKRKNEDATSDGSKIKAGEKKKLQKRLDAVETKQLQVKDLMAKAQTFGEMIPTYVISNAGDMLKASGQVMEQAKEAIEKTSGDFNALIGSLDMQLQELGACATRVKSQVDQASAFK